MGSNCADHGGVGDIFASITGDVFVINNEEFIRSFGAMAISVWSCSYALAEATYLVGESLVPYFGVYRLVAQLVIYELAGVFIEDSHGPERCEFTGVGVVRGLGGGG